MFYETWEERAYESEWYHGCESDVEILSLFFYLEIVFEREFAKLTAKQEEYEKRGAVVSLAEIRSKDFQNVSFVGSLLSYQLKAGNIGLVLEALEGKLLLLLEDEVNQIIYFLKFKGDTLFQFCFDMFVLHNCFDYAQKVLDEWYKQFPTRKPYPPQKELRAFITQSPAPSPRQICFCVNNFGLRIFDMANWLSETSASSLAAATLEELEYTETFSELCSKSLCILLTNLVDIILSYSMGLDQSICTLKEILAVSFARSVITNPGD